MLHEFFQLSLDKIIIFEGNLCDFLFRSDVLRTDMSSAARSDDKFQIFMNFIKNFHEFQNVKESLN